MREGTPLSTSRRDSDATRRDVTLSTYAHVVANSATPRSSADEQIHTARRERGGLRYGPRPDSAATDDVRSRPIAAKSPQTGVLVESRRGDSNPRPHHYEGQLQRIPSPETGLTLDNHGNSESGGSGGLNVMRPKYGPGRGRRRRLVSLHRDSSFACGRLRKTLESTNPCEWMAACPVHQPRHQGQAVGRHVPEVDPPRGCSKLSASSGGSSATPSSSPPSTRARSDRHPHRHRHRGGRCARHRVVVTPRPPSTRQPGHPPECG
jgi:hypothetical protein